MPQDGNSARANFWSRGNPSKRQLRGRGAPRSHQVLRSGGERRYDRRSVQLPRAKQPVERILVWERQLPRAEAVLDNHRLRGESLLAKLIDAIEKRLRG